MKRTSQMNRFRGVLSFRAVAAFLLLSLFSATAVASSYPIRFKRPDHLYGKTAEDFEFTFTHPEKNLIVPFVEESAGGKGRESYHGSACYDAEGFHLLVFARGGRRESVPECGGSLSLYLRPGADNIPTGRPPVMLVYSMERFPAPPAAEKMFGPAQNEHILVRSEPVRFSSPMATYGSSLVPLPARDPEVAFHPMDGGWMVRFSFRWVDLHEFLPFARGAYPVPWRIIVKRSRPDGTAASWGTLAEPVVLNWGRPGDAIADEIPLTYFLRCQYGPACHGVAEFLRTYWTTYRQEQWMARVDPPFPTFEPKNPASDDLFYRSLVGPLLDANKEIDKAIYFNLKENIPLPPIKGYGPAEQREVIAGIDRIRNIAERVDDARRDYLLARFLDKPVPARRLPGRARPEKPGKPPLAPGTDGLGLDEAGDDLIIDLDDVDF